jgi:hypothetical protein
MVWNSDSILLKYTVNFFLLESKYYDSERVQNRPNKNNKKLEMDFFNSTEITTFVFFPKFPFCSDVV